MTTPLACYLRQAVNRENVKGIDVLFAGLAPSDIGVYQLDVRIPLDWPAGAARIECRMGRLGGRGEVAIGAGR